MDEWTGNLDSIEPIVYAIVYVLVIAGIMAIIYKDK